MLFAWVCEYASASIGLDNSPRVLRSDHVAYTYGAREDVGNIWEEDTPFLTSGALSHFFIAVLRLCF